MKVILKESIESLGKRGDIVDVAAGYGRNYLIPKKLALKVTSSNMKMVEMEQQALRKKLEKDVQTFQVLVDKLDRVSLSFKRKAGEKDVIFGSVSTTDIREALLELGIDIEKKKILLEEPIKRLGNYTVPVRVFHDQQAEIKLAVVKEGAPEKEKAEGPVAEETQPLVEAAPDHAGEALPEEQEPERVEEGTEQAPDTRGEEADQGDEEAEEDEGKKPE